MMRKGLSQFFSQNKTLVILIGIGSLSWVLTVFRSGINGQFWGANGHDGLWHVALANSLARGGLEMPVFSGYYLRNYHIGYDLFLALLNKITAIPTINLYFQIVPIFLSLAIGATSYLFVKNWQGKKEALWAVFFVYFGGSWAWIFGKQDSMFWSQQSITTLINPPFALSLLIIFSGLYLLQKYEKKTSPLLWVLIALLFGSLSQIKIYAFILVLAALLASSIRDFLFNRNFKLLTIFLGSAIIGALIYVPINGISEGVIQFYPFWFLETMMLFPDRVGWTKYYNAMFSYVARDEWLKAIIFYVGAFSIFALGNFGSRIISKIYFLRSIKNWKKISTLEVFFYTVITAGFVIPMLFVQSGTAWNTIQFLYYSLFFTGIVAGVSLARLNSKVLAFVVILLTIPTTTAELKNIYLTPQASVVISEKELEALNFLSSQDEGVVLTYPVEHAKSTSYVSAYSNKPVYLEDEINLTIMGYGWEKRRVQVEDFYENPSDAFLQENDVGYIYLVDGQRYIFNEKKLSTVKIFENEEVDVYKVIY